MIKETSCGIITFDNNKVLLVKHNGGHVSFPKGHVEKNETYEETAYREVKEETGIDAKIISKDYFVNTYSPKENITKDVIFFVGIKEGGELKPQVEEVSLCDFIPIKEAMKKITFYADKRILTEAYELYKKISK